MAMMPFIKQGPTFLVAANATAPSGVQIQCNGNILTNTLRLFNDSNQSIYVGVSNTAQGAKDNAVIPGSSGNQSLGLAAGMVEVIRTNVSTPALFVSGVCANSTQANLMVTPGEGI